MFFENKLLLEAFSFDLIIYQSILCIRTQIKLKPKLHYVFKLFLDIAVVCINTWDNEFRISGTHPIQNQKMYYYKNVCSLIHYEILYISNLVKLFALKNMICI